VELIGHAQDIHLSRNHPMHMLPVASFTLRPQHQYVIPSVLKGQ